MQKFRMIILAFIFTSKIFSFTLSEKKEAFSEGLVEIKNVCPEDTHINYGDDTLGGLKSFRIICSRDQKLPLVSISGMKNSGRSRTWNFFPNGMISIQVNSPKEKECPLIQQIMILPIRHTKNIQAFSSGQKIKNKNSEIENPEFIRFRTASGLSLDFDRDGSINFANPEVSIKRESGSFSISPNDLVEMKSFKGGVVIDLGVKSCNDPISDINRDVTLYDGANPSNECRFKVKEIFSTSIKNGYVEKYERIGSDIELALKIESKCSKFNTLHLRNPYLYLPNIQAERSHNILPVDTARNSPKEIDGGGVQKANGAKSTGQ